MGFIAENAFVLSVWSISPLNPFSKDQKIHCIGKDSVWINFYSLRLYYSGNKKFGACLKTHYHRVFNQIMIVLISHFKIIKVKFLFNEDLFFFPLGAELPCAWATRVDATARPWSSSRTRPTATWPSSGTSITSVTDTLKSTKPREKTSSVWLEVNLNGCFMLSII